MGMAALLSVGRQRTDLLQFRVNCEFFIARINWSQQENTSIKHLHRTSQNAKIDKKTKQ